MSLLIYFEEHPDMSAARRRERQLKGWSGAKKDELIAAINPERRDLFDDPAGSMAEL